LPTYMFYTYDVVPFVNLQRYTTLDCY
jgi:hypothetical protein